MAYILNWENKGVYWKYSGVASGGEIISATTEIYGDDRFDQLKYKLVDFSEVDEIDISDSEVRLIALQHGAAATSNPVIKNAIVVSTVTPQVEFFAQFLEKSSNWEVRIFTDLAEANQWVGR